MLAGSVLSLVRKPIVGRRVNSFSSVCFQKLLDLCNSHRAPDNLTDARHQQIAALSEHLPTLPWPTGRGNPLRNGMGAATAP